MRREGQGASPRARGQEDNPSCIQHDVHMETGGQRLSKLCCPFMRLQTRNSTIYMTSKHHEFAPSEGLPSTDFMRKTSSTQSIKQHAPGPRTRRAVVSGRAGLWPMAMSGIDRCPRGVRGHLRAEPLIPSKAAGSPCPAQPAVRAPRRAKIPGAGCPTR